MADRSVVLAVKVVADAKQATAEVDRAAGKFGKVGKGIQAAAAPAALLGGALLLGAKKAVDAASKTEQAMGGLDAVFGSNAKQMKDWAAAAADSVGLSKSSYGELATLIGSQLKNAGVPADQLSGKTNNLIKTGADLAAMYGGTTAEAVGALSSALKGEMDPMEKYGASLTESAVKAEMAAQGTDKLTGKQATAAKSAAVLSLIQKQTADAHGAAAREADSAAAKQQELNAKMENMAATMGAILLPIVSNLASMLGKLAGWAEKNATAFQILVGVIGAIVVAVLAVNAAMKIYQAGLLVTQAIQKATWLSNPIFLVIAAVILLVAGIVLLYKKSETFRRIVNAVWAAVKTGAQAAGAVIKTVFLAVWRAISAAARVFGTAVRAVFNVIRSVARAVGNAVKAAWRLVWSAASAYVRTYVSVIRAVFNTIRSVVRSVTGFVKTAWSTAWNAVKAAARTVTGPIRAAMDAAKNAINNVIAAVKSVIQWLGRIKPPGALESVFNAIKTAIDRVIGAVSSLIGWLGRIKVPRINIPFVGGNSAAPAVATGTAAPTVYGVGAHAATPTSSASGGLTINVNGALDPEAVARQIQRILTGHQRRIGNARAVAV